MLNFVASKLRVKGGPSPASAPPPDPHLDYPDLAESATSFIKKSSITFKILTSFLKIFFAEICFRDRDA